MNDVSEPDVPEGAVGSKPDARVQGPWWLTWSRFRRDRWSVAAAVGLIAIFVVVTVGGPIAGRLLHHNGTDLFPYAASASLKPVGPWTRRPGASPGANRRVRRPASAAARYGDHAVRARRRRPPRTRRVAAASGRRPCLARNRAWGRAGRILIGVPFGRAPAIVSEHGRDRLAVHRDGDGVARWILLLVFASVRLPLIGVPFGLLAGYFGGTTDAIVSRFTEMAMAFPLILLLVFASVRLQRQLTALAYGSVLSARSGGVAILIGIFTCFYVIRLVRARGHVHDAEFGSQAAHMARRIETGRILRRTCSPSRPGLLVWAGIAAATDMLLEVVHGSFIGAGVEAAADRGPGDHCVRPTRGTRVSAHLRRPAETLPGKRCSRRSRSSSRWCA